MNVFQLIRSRVQGCRRRVESDGQDLLLYRQLRRTESRFFEAREGLRRMQESRQKIEAEHAQIMQACDDSAQQDLAGQLDRIQKEIAFLETDMNRMESEYKQAQMNVRTYFYLETYPGRLPEGGVAAGQSAQ